MSRNIPFRDKLAGHGVRPDMSGGHKILLDRDITWGLGVEHLPQMSGRQSGPKDRTSCSAPDAQLPIFLHLIEIIPAWVASPPVLRGIPCSLREIGWSAKTIPYFHTLKRVFRIAVWRVGRYWDARFDDKHGDISV